MNEVFADAYYFVARLNHRDQHRQRVMNFVPQRDLVLVTTEWILMEVADAVADSDIRGRFRDYIQELQASKSCEIIEATSSLFDRALNLYHKHIDKDWSLTDCTSFIVMRDRGITEALTGDKHFEQAGFIPLFK